LSKLSALGSNVGQILQGFVADKSQVGQIVTKARHTILQVPDFFVGSTICLSQANSGVLASFPVSRPENLAVAQPAWATCNLGFQIMGSPNVTNFC
jgi:hypothetical protein